MINISGQHQFTAPPAAVYATLTDPATFERHIDACQKVEPTGPNAFAAQVAINAMGLRVNQAINIQLADLVPPTACAFALDAKSQFGNATGRIALALEPNGAGANLTYTGSATLTGLLTSVGPRLIEVSLNRLLGEFFAKINADL